MRRKDKEITNKGFLETIIAKTKVCRLALVENNVPYVVPLNFGYHDGFLYFHSAAEGKKIDILRENNNVCFEMDVDVEIVQAESNCNWGAKYLSVIGFGKAFFINDPVEKKKALDIIMEHYTGHDGPYEYHSSAMERIVVIKVQIESMTGKNSGYQMS